MYNLTPEACRAARAILKWSMRDLAREAQVSPTTVQQMEAGQPVRKGTKDAIVDAFGSMGVKIADNGVTGAHLLQGSGFLATAHERRGRILAARADLLATPVADEAIRREVLERMNVDVARCDDQIRRSVAAELAGLQLFHTT